MKRLLALLALAACAAPSNPEDGAPLLEARARPSVEGFGVLPPAAHRLQLMAAPATPLGPETLTTSQISITISGHLSKVQNQDGTWTVQVPPQGARLVGYSTTDGTVGAALNWPGWKATTFEGPFLHRDTQVPAGTALMAEDALVVASGSTNVGSRGTYPYAFAGRSQCDEMTAVVFVSWQPTGNELRGPAWGAGPLARFFRATPVPIAALDVASLPSTLDLTGTDVSMDYLVRLNRPFMGEAYAGWFTDNSTPDWQNGGYGREVASITSLTGMGLCSTYPDKRALAVAVAQRGFDLVGAFADGRQQICGGGHAAGRKAYIIYLGRMLHLAPFENPSAFLGPVFQEDQQYFRAFPAWWFGWTGGWRFKPENEGATVNGLRLLQSPTTWGDFEAADHSTWGWMVNGYLQHCCGSQVGTALAMSLLGCTDGMGRAHFEMIYQFMVGPPPAAKAMLDVAGCRVVWGEDYAAGRGAGVQAAQWRRTIH